MERKDIGVQEGYLVIFKEMTFGIDRLSPRKPPSFGPFQFDLKLTVEVAEKEKYCLKNLQ